MYDSSLDYNPSSDLASGCCYCVLDLINNDVIVKRTVVIGANECPFHDTHVYRSDLIDIDSMSWNVNTSNDFVFVYDSGSLLIADDMFL